MTDKIYFIPWLPFSDGICLPPIGVFVTDRADRKLIFHELGHWEQAQEWGIITFYCKVIGQYIKHGRKKAPVERDADIRGVMLRRQYNRMHKFKER